MPHERTTPTSSSTPTRATQLTTTTPETSDDGYVVRSPNRPLTRSARRALAEYEIIDDVESDTAGRNGGVITADRPPQEVLDTHELYVDEPPDEVWTTGDTRIEIYIAADRVVVDGRDTPTDVDTAQKKCRSQARFTRVDTPDHEALEG